MAQPSFPRGLWLIRQPVNAGSRVEERCVMNRLNGRGSSVRAAGACMSLESAWLSDDLFKHLDNHRSLRLFCTACNKCIVHKTIHLFFRAPRSAESLDDFCLIFGPSDNRWDLWGWKLQAARMEAIEGCKRRGGRRYAAFGKSVGT